VRLATHANYKEFILTAGLEFFPLGGDPKLLAECMFSCDVIVYPTSYHWNINFLGLFTL
jgi:hypothetical protein